MSETIPDEISNIKLKPPSNDEVGLLYTSFNQLTGTIEKLIQDIHDKNRQKRELELKMFQFQINPHFLYNALDSIAWRALISNQDDLVEMANQLADIFRYSTKSIVMEANIREECNMLEKYVSLQQKRYENDIVLTSMIDPDCSNLVIPKCLLQPLVENAIIHWDNQEEDVIRITVSAKKTKTGYSVSVIDNGHLCDTGLLNAYLNENGDFSKKNSIGLKNVVNRIRLSFGEHSYLNFSKDSNDNTIATIHIMQPPA